MIIIRRALTRKPQISVGLRAQHLLWQLGHYQESFTIGYGGRSIKRRWIVDAEAEQHNLVLDQTYDDLIASHGFVNISSYAVVGTGSSAPAASQTGLDSELVRTNNEAQATDITRTADGVYEVTRYKEFTEAEVGGQNLTEWGFSPSSTAGNNLMSRELFRDGSGNAITVTVASDQRLRLIYKTKITFSPVTATATSINIANLGTRTGKYLWNVDRCGSASYGYPDQGDLKVANGFAVGSVDRFTVSDTSYTGTYTESTAEPGKPYKAPTFQAYTSGDRQRLTNQITFEANEANILIASWGFGSLNDPCGSGYYTKNMLFVFDSGQEVDKQNTHKLIIDPFTMTWGP